MALPSGYKRLAYITADGSQHFDTGFIPDQSTRVVLDIELTSSETQALFGSRVAAQSKTFTVFVLGDTSVRYDYGSIQNSLTVDAVKRRVTVEANGNVLNFGAYSVTATADTFDCAYSLYLLNVNTANAPARTTSAAGNIYGGQVYGNGAQVREYIPCETDTGEVGLWDDINSTFGGDAAGVGFIAGPEYGNIEPAGDHNTRISDVSYALESGTTLVDGAAYEIESGMTLVDGVEWEIPFGGGLHTVTLGASTMSSRAYAEVDGVKYTTAVTLQVKSGTTLTIFAKKTSTRNTYVKLNGERVLTAGGTTFFSEYSMAIESDVTVEYSGTGTYTVDITTS